MKKCICVCSLIILCSCVFPFKSMAAEVSKGMTTIRVDASDNESQDLMYAIDSDSPDAFSTSNEFVVEAGTSHTVYVKDAAGNISGQVITAPIEKVDIDVTIGQHGTDSAVSSDNTNNTNNTPAIESGGGAINETTITDGSNTAEKIFYTITTPNDHVFYMVIDNTRSADNVYLLNQVTEDDLLSLVKEGDQEKKDTGIFTSEETVENPVPEPEIKQETSESKSTSTLPLVLAVILILGGGYYYMKVYKPKKDAEIDLQDAMDMEDFEAENEEEVLFEEDLYFGESQEDKDRLLEAIVGEDNDNALAEVETSEKEGNDESNE